MLYDSISLEETLFGESRAVIVEYRIPVDGWDAIEIKSVKLVLPGCWNQDGTPGNGTRIVDMRPVLTQWQVEDIEDRILAKGIAKAAAEELAA